MKILETVASLQKIRQTLNCSIGFVPTMGALHQGHLSLMEKASQENEILVVSVFVNPTQFDEASDLDNYPRTLEKDIALIEQLNPEALLFCPSVDEIYGETPYVKTYEFESLDLLMEGASRQGHFQGVATVVERLLNLVRPTRAYFGEKDFQQLLIIRKMVEQTALTTEIIGCPIKREADGLAMSSRNQRLTKEQRLAAPLVFETLQKARSLFQSKPPESVYLEVQAIFESKPDWELDYFTICDSETLAEITVLEVQKARGFIAAKLGDIRLIDNIPF